MLVISGIFLFSSRYIGYLGNLIKGIFSNLLKGIQDTFLFTSRDIGYGYPPPPKYKPLYCCSHCLKVFFCLNAELSALSSFCKYFSEEGGAGCATLIVLLLCGKPRILSLFPNSFNKFNKT